MVLNKKPVPRLPSLDIIRGFAVLLMVEVHIAINVPFFSQVAITFAAPTFLFVAGVSLQLMLRNRKSKGKDAREAFPEVFWRAVTLFFLTSAITWTSNLVLGWDYSVFLDVFVVIALGLLVGVLVHHSFLRKILAILIILSLNVVIQNYQVEALYFLTGGLSQDPLQVTILPYLAFFFFGQMAYKVYKHKNFNFYDNQILLIYAVLFFLLNLAFYLAFPYPFHSLAGTYLPELLMVSSLLIILALALVRLVDLDGRMKGLLRPLENLGRISFTSYYLTFISFVIIGSLELQEAWINVVIFLVTALALVTLEKMWRPFGYRYGLEWLYRRISVWLWEYRTRHPKRYNYHNR